MSKEFTRLRETIAMLRHPNKGCPWDLEQTHESLTRFLVEEAFEYIHAVSEQDYPEMEEELGDVLLQVLLHAQIASETKQFDIDSVCLKLNEKMIRRHPHVFANPNSNITTKELHQNWEQIKLQEKGESPAYAFSKKDLILPPLLAAYKIGLKSTKVDFDWDKPDEVWQKVQEEITELEQEIKNNNKDKIEEELGDVLFSLAQLARHFDIEPDKALRQANQKFVKRFSQMEELIAPKQITELSREEKEKLWTQVKKR